MTTPDKPLRRFVIGHHTGFVRTDAEWAHPRDDGQWCIADEADAALAAKDAEIAELRYQRDEILERARAHDEGYEPPALEDDTPMTRADIEELIEQADRFRGDREGEPVWAVVEVYEAVCFRSEIVAYAAEVRRCWKEIAELRAERERLQAVVSKAIDLRNAAKSYVEAERGTCGESLCHLDTTVVLDEFDEVLETLTPTRPAEAPSDE